MTIKASEVNAFFKQLELNYDDKGPDRDGDHIFTTGFPAKDYVDFDGQNNFMCQFQLLEKKSGTGDGHEREIEIKALTTELIELDPFEEMEKFTEIRRKLKDLKEGGSEAEYEMIAVYIPRLNSNKLKRPEALEAVNEVNVRMKCARLAIDSHEDVIFYYQLILEDGKLTLNQFKRLIGVTVSAVNQFGKVVNSK